MKKWTSAILVLPVIIGLLVGVPLCANCIRTLGAAFFKTGSRVLVRNATDLPLRCVTVIAEPDKQRLGDLAPRSSQEVVIKPKDSQRLRINFNVGDQPYSADCGLLDAGGWYREVEIVSAAEVRVTLGRDKTTTSEAAQRTRQRDEQADERGCDG